MHCRKTLMSCGTNYWSVNYKALPDLGVGAGSSLTRTVAPSDSIEAFAFDEGTAFTYIRLPSFP